MVFPSQISFKSYLQTSLAEVGVFNYDVVFLYVDLRAFSVNALLFENRDLFMQAFIEPFIQRNITVIIPTFTFTTEGEFYVESTPTRLGAMNKWFLGVNGVVRSNHPLFSFAAIGPKAQKLLETGKSAFGAKSAYDLYQNERTAFLHIGIPMPFGNSFLHYIEQLCGASYRYNKVYKTKVYNCGEYIGTDFSAMVRRLDNPNDDYRASFEKISNRLFDHKLIREVGNASGLLNFSCYPMADSIDLLVDWFYQDPCIFIRTDYKEYE
jgi:aminoglycoside 3-N-acetyltransferase